MSTFGQVWVFSASAFVLGAFLAWLFLVRPAKSHIRDLEWRLADSEARARAEHDELDMFDEIDEFDKFDELVEAGRFNAEPEPFPEFESVEAETTHHIPIVPAQIELADHLPLPPMTMEPSEPAPEAPAPEAVEPAEEELTQVIPAISDRTELPLPDRPELPDPKRSDDSSPIGSVLEPDGGTEIGKLLEPANAESTAGDLGAAGSTGAVGDEKRAPSLFAPQSFPEDARQEDPDPNPPAYAFGGPDAKPDDEAEAERTTVLPKRRPQENTPAKLDQANPASLANSAKSPRLPRRMPASREEKPDQAGNKSGSLFEPMVNPPAPDQDEAQGVSETGPFGPGSAAPTPDGASPSADYPVKANVTLLRYATDDAPEFGDLVAEVWFRSAADAEKVGFRPVD